MKLKGIPEAAFAEAMERLLNRANPGTILNNYCDEIQFPIGLCTFLAVVSLLLGRTVYVSNKFSNLYIIPSFSVTVTKLCVLFTT